MHKYIIFSENYTNKQKTNTKEEKKKIQKKKKNNY